MVPWIWPAQASKATGAEATVTEQLPVITGSAAITGIGDWVSMTETVLLEITGGKKPSETESTTVLRPNGRLATRETEFVAGPALAGI